MQGAWWGRCLRPCCTGADVTPAFVAPPPALHPCWLGTPAHAAPICAVAGSRGCSPGGAGGQRRAEGQYGVCALPSSSHPIPVPLLHPQPLLFQPCLLPHLHSLPPSLSPHLVPSLAPPCPVPALSSSPSPSSAPNLCSPPPSIFILLHSPPCPVPTLRPHPHPSHPAPAPSRALSPVPPTGAGHE